MMRVQNQNEYSSEKLRWTPPKLTRIDAGDAEGGLLIGPDLLVLGS